MTVSVVRVPATPSLYVLWSLSLLGPLTPLLSRDEMGLYLWLDHHLDEAAAADEVGRADRVTDPPEGVADWLDGSGSTKLEALATLIEDFAARIVSGEVGELFVVRLIERSGYAQRMN